MNTEHNDSALKDLGEIRKIMERSSKFISLSGLSGIFAGIFALIGSGFAYRILNWGGKRFSEQGYNYADGIGDGVKWLLLDGVLVLVFSLAFAYFFTRRKAKRLGLPMWDKSAKKLMMNLLLPLAAGGIFCLILLLKYNLVYLIAPATLLFYGLALINASKFSFDELRYLGLSEVLLGLLATYFYGYGLLFWAVGFGVLHIIYGIVMYKKHQ